ncbi:hypothetical protein Pth03_39000 [Planotetraspora thailandica]|uniref:Uncharacterized protein n=1 Tax=Planotetraspora thailandica TaxID=487172 RepID=A0A8J3V2H6_9ACTN|nr:hypothetical protein [Planotetraspora thailandica]GII55511.1 hypothetical protein Pth03_39000 [Planotetraspora thailandica]
MCIQAALVEFAGAPLTIIDADLEAPCADEILVRIQAAGLCPAGPAAGWNFWGHLGDGTTTDRHTPVTVPRLSSVTQISRWPDGFRLEAEERDRR